MLNDYNTAIAESGYDTAIAAANTAATFDIADATQNYELIRSGATITFCTGREAASLSRAANAQSD